MTALATKRCLNHDSREAVSRCPSCGNYFCRECVVVFESKLICANCLALLTSQIVAVPQRRFGVASIALAISGLLLTWLLFYATGWTILQLFRERAPLA